jgi:hypothetical protein
MQPFPDLHGRSGELGEAGFDLSLTGFGEFELGEVGPIPARRTWWRRMPASTRPRTRRPRKPRASSASSVCIPNRSTKSPERKREQKKRWLRNGQKWRTGCEGRISVVKRRHGLGRSRYKGDAGIKRWVGLGVIADNLVNISRVMAKQPSR